jgi:antitoxin YefM
MVVSPEIAVHGTVDPGFEGVRAAFEGNFAVHGDVGASVAVTPERRRGDGCDRTRLPTKLVVVLFLVQLGKGRTMAITASEARKNLFPLIEQVNEDRTPVEITSKRGDAVLIGLDDFRALEETAYLLRSPANVRRLVESLEQARAGEVQQHELDR